MTVTLRYRLSFTYGHLYVIFIFRAIPWYKGLLATLLRSIDIFANLISNTNILVYVETPNTIPPLDRRENQVSK